MIMAPVMNKEIKISRLNTNNVKIITNKL